MLKKYNGKLIVLDGIDGAGKTTQTELLVCNLRKSGLKADTVSFPNYTGTVFGKIITRYLKGDFGDIANTSPYLVAPLYAADRFELQEDLLQKLSDNHIVIATRYTVSNIAYQAAKLPPKQRDEFRKLSMQLDYEVFKNPKEDAVIFLSMPPNFSATLLDKRKADTKQKDIHEDDKDYMIQVWQEYLLYCKQNNHCYTIDCTQDNKIRSIQNISTELTNLVLEILKNTK